MLAEVGELVFSFVVGYMGALEFFFVVRHLYHWSFGHNPEMRDLKGEADSLQKLQDHLRNSISDASEKEAMGLKAMRDGVRYKDGFRVYADQSEIDELKERVKKQDQKAERQKEIEAELARQRKIEEETRKQLKEAEEALRRVEEEKERERLKAEEKKRAEEEEEQSRQRAEEEENMRKIVEAERKMEEEKRRIEEEEESRLKEEAENARKLLEAEREREEKQRLREVEAENTRKLLEAEREREEAERLRELEAENTRKLLEAEREREEAERRRELEEENTRKLLEAEREREEVERIRAIEAENTRKLLEAEREREEAERIRELEEENTRKLIEAEREREEAQRLRELEEENTRKLLEAEREREEKQRQQELQDEEIIRKLLEAERRREEEEEEKVRKQLELEREREQIEYERELEEDNSRRLLEAEREREERQRLQELQDEEIIRKLLEAERQREQEEDEEEENTRKLLESERELEEEQRRLEDEQTRQRNEEEENYRRLVQMEREMEERERLEEEERKALLEHAAALERETADRLIHAEKEAALKQRQIEENEENMRNLLEAERELEQKKQEMEKEANNLRQLIEAEKEMEERQRRLDEEALQKLKNAQEEVELRQTLDVGAEEPFVKKEITHSEHSPVPTVKTQYGQTGTDSLKPKTLHFPGVSEESSSAEPASSKQSSFSTQQSSEAVLPDMNFDEYERQAPDGGEDMPSLQYSDDYLRSLDGIKSKPLVREDGSGRRRAFKKRRSSGSSTSSRESRASREEELKMFTSLEEEEFENIRKGDSEYESIKYASEPNLKVGRQHRRHKRSPAKDSKRDANDATKGSLEMLDEEDANPWGEVKPEHYKDTEFWKREKRLSIDEELDEETDARQRLQSPSSPSAVNIPKMSSFEEATKSQNEEAISVLKRQRSKDPEPIKESEEASDTKNVSRIDEGRLSPAGSNSSSASASASKSPAALISPELERENSHETETRTPSPTSTGGGGLRRSPRVDEMKLYKEQWKSEDRKARAEAGENPAIEIDYASDDEPDDQEYLMEGISDFYDFNVSIYPSRSRSRSRSKSPAVNRSVSPHQRRTPSPQNLSHNPATTKSRSPSPDPASYKFIYQRILPSLAADQQGQVDIDGLSDYYDFHSKLNRETLTGMTKRRSSEAHRTSVDYVMEDLENETSSGAGAIAKRILELRRTPTTPDYERSISAEWRDIQKLKEELLSGTFKRSTYAGESMDFSDQFEHLREEAKAFRRSHSRSRSPGYDVEEMTKKLQAKKALQEKILKDITKTSENLEDFSDDITKAYVDLNRRASDTVLIQKPEILFQIQDLIQESDENLDVLELEADEYHHFRRYSLNQEVPIEQYPEDYVCISEIEVKSMTDLRTWTGILDSPSIEEMPVTLEELPAESKDPKSVEDVVEEAYESDSDDERQTVVEVEDEIDEDIWDYNERPEESHNEQSECEEADREMDRYADRHADDWRDIEGAVGGVLDDDSFQIDQIYDEAIKNRKPSGLLRDYESILQDIQITDEDRLDEERRIVKDAVSNENGAIMERGLWSPRSRSSRASSGESSRSFLENERRENERRYLGDATMSAINSTRLRSRYGIVPSTSFTTTYDDELTDIDINYVPRKEYNWRKNFKLDDEGGVENKENHMQYLDSRKFSLGGESITLFSQSPEHSEDGGELSKVVEGNEIVKEQLEKEMEEKPEEMIKEKPSKKKKNKRKSRKGSKGSIGGNEEGTENGSRKNSIATEGDMPKKKSRRESNADIAADSQVGDASLPDVEIEEDSQPKKKSKKRKKAKQESTLPILNIRLPSPEKKPQPLSVAAIRAALTAPPPVEVKAPLSSRKSPKIEDLIGSRDSKSPVTLRQSPITEQASKSPKIENLVGQKPLRDSKEQQPPATERTSKSSKTEELSSPQSSQDPKASASKQKINSQKIEDVTSPKPQPSATEQKPESLEVEICILPQLSHEKTLPATLQQSPITEQNPSLTTVPTSVSPQPASILAATSIQSDFSSSSNQDPSHPPARTPLSPTLVIQNSTTISVTNESNNTPKTPSTPDAYYVIKDGGLYPLF